MSPFILREEKDEVRYSDQTANCNAICPIMLTHLGSN